MFIAILCGIAALIAVGFLVFNPYYEDRGEQLHWGRPVGVALLLVAALVFALFSWTSVGAKNVGVLTTFGKPSDRTLDPGFHWTWPWQETTEIDGSVQSREYEGDDCIYVKIGDGSRSCVTTTINWRIVPEKAHLIYSDYRDDDDYDDDPVDAYWGKVLSKQYKAAIQSAFADYNPVAQLETVSGGDQKATDLSFSPDLKFYEDRLRTEMEERLGDEPLAEIESITISYFSFSESTQETINDFIEAVGETRITAQGKETAREQAETNQILEESVNNDPLVLVARCFELIAEGAFDPPAGFSCWNGAGNAVVVPSQ
jgi:regulator of protease activity HflC (stomatin/prohibitin superfamily)